jgi:DNA-binding transcriptional MerR regulator
VSGTRASSEAFTAEGHTTLSPSELARLTGVSTDTLRHYERKRVLPRPTRSPNGYRRYPAYAVDRVRLVQRALRVGFSLAELARVLSERERGNVPCRSVRALVAERLADLEARLRDLATLRGEMRQLLRGWDDRLAATPIGKQARLLDLLAGQRSAAPKHPTAPPSPVAPMSRTRRLRVRSNVSVTNASERARES